MSGRAEELPPTLVGQPFVWVNDRTLPFAGASIPLFDRGFQQGAAVAENFRTVRGAAWNLARHMARLHSGLALAGIRLPCTQEQLEHRIGMAIAHHHRLIDADDDLSVYLSVTAGVGRSADEMGWGPLGSVPVASAGPVLTIHATPIDFARWGIPFPAAVRLQQVPVREVPAQSLPRELKSRSRMHYWLAEQALAGFPKGTLPLMIGLDGMVADTSTGTLAVVDRQSRTWTIPSTGQCLAGTTLPELFRVVEPLGYRLEARGISLAELKQAGEVFWFNSALMMLPVVGIGETVIGEGRGGSCFEECSRAISSAIGLDYLGQAVRFSTAVDRRTSRE